MTRAKKAAMQTPAQTVYLTAPWINKTTKWTSKPLLEGPKGPVASMVGPQAVELPATEPVLDALSTRVTSATLTVASHLAGSTEAAEAFKNFARDKHHYYCGDEKLF